MKPKTIIQKKEVKSKGIFFSISNHRGQQVARAYLYLINNQLHQKPYGLLEDLCVQDDQRGRGYGSVLVKEVIKQAKRLGCYKLIATSRHTRRQVHRFYRKMGFQDYGKEFRLDL